MHVRNNQKGVCSPRTHVTARKTTTVTGPKNKPAIQMLKATTQPCSCLQNRSRGPTQPMVCKCCPLVCRACADTQSQRPYPRLQHTTKPTRRQFKGRWSTQHAALQLLACFFLPKSVVLASDATHYTAMHCNVHKLACTTTSRQRSEPPPCSITYRPQVVNTLAGPPLPRKPIKHTAPQVHQPSPNNFCSMPS